MELLLWVPDRASDPGLGSELRRDVLSPSPIASSSDCPLSQKMSEGELQEVIEDHRIAARNAIEAGFDSVEIQGGGGYLSDQFPQDLTNKRTDHWGGSIKNRARFPHEVVKAIA
ncbi:nadh:flavin oxidoreductase nadh oxidase family [Fusarium sp. NRRL 25303]|nr:nadh:flavin oxidoreductase nadh oxidase family [Fusarium sp. NRRL 25303]